MNALSMTPHELLGSCPACHGEVSVGVGESAGECPCPHCKTLLWFVSKPVGSAVVLTFLPGLIAGAESLGRVDEVLAVAEVSPKLVLDLSHLRLISSLFLAMLVKLNRVLASGKMRICGLDEVGRETIRVTHLDQLFQVFDDQQSATES